jgi:HSP20 family protein
LKQKEENTMNRVMHPMTAWRSDLDRLFNGFFDEWPGLDRTTAFPALNVWEDERNYFVEAELPGLRMENVEVSIVGPELTLKGQRKEEPAKDAIYHRRERGTGSFVRSIRLPAPVDSNEVKATLQNGVLAISLPKAKEAQPRKIEVKCLDK